MNAKGVVGLRQNVDQFKGFGPVLVMLDIMILHAHGSKTVEEFQKMDEKKHDEKG